MGRRATLVLLAAVAVGLAIVGWREFYFLTDDAFIAFRYVSNAVEGRGLVWNPAPFLPVEGYTCWLWVMLLWGIWEATGIEPPDAAGVLSLLFGLGTLAIAGRLAAQLPLGERGERLRPALLAVVLLGIVSNRSFLAWLSSGLETALFNFTLTAWVALALAHRRPVGLATRIAFGSAAAACALTRPDGLLVVAGTGVLVGADALRRGRIEPARLAALAPLVLPLLHILWRYGFYGSWLPNTYFAKDAGAWPQSGLRYAASFALEYALWMWAGAVAWWIARRGRTWKPEWDALPAVIAISVLAAHFLYYTLRVGGDHFEYRVYSHLIPLLFVSFPWVLLRSGLSPLQSIAATALFVLLSWPIPWAHHFATRDLTRREETHVLVEPVTERLPPPFTWLARPFDALQGWLIPKHVGMRHREHAVYVEQLRLRLPDRSQGSRLGWEGRPVLAAGNVGVIGWVLPNVAIIDIVGLNDYVVARTPPPDDGEVLMAHDRVAPPSYVKCFQPNVLLTEGNVQVLERPVPLTDDDIIRCETEWRARAGEALPGFGSG